MSLITGVVHTRDEARNIGRCLASLKPWCDELLVADMGSSDDTVAIASSNGAKVVSVPDYGYVEPAYADALAHVGTPWVMRIDADEVVPHALAQRLVRIAQDDEADVVSGGRLNYMFGRPLRATGWEPESDRQYFFFKRDSLTTLPVGVNVHVPPVPRPGTRVIALPAEDNLCVWHFNYIDWSHFLAKMDRYTTIEAGHLRDVRGETTRRMARELAARGIKHRAWRDGREGLALVWMQMTYRLLAGMKRRQLNSVGDSEAIRASYDAIARAAAETELE